MGDLRTIRKARKPRTCARRHRGQLHTIQPGELYVRVTYPPTGLIDEWQGATLCLRCAIDCAPTRQDAASLYRANVERGTPP